MRAKRDRSEYMREYAKTIPAPIVFRLSKVDVDRLNDFRLPGESDNQAAKRLLIEVMDKKGSGNV